MDCSIPGCTRPTKAHGWCNTHYERWRKHGDPSVVRKAVPPQSWRAVLARIRINSETTCWEWHGYVLRGYGAMSIGNSTVLVHRFMYEFCVGPIPEEHEIDHLCHNRSCCNPDHLEPVTRGENMRRAWADGRYEDRLSG